MDSRFTAMLCFICQPWPRGGLSQFGSLISSISCAKLAFIIKRQCFIGFCLGQLHSCCQYSAGVYFATSACLCFRRRIFTTTNTHSVVEAHARAAFYNVEIVLSLVGTSNVFIFPSYFLLIAGQSTLRTYPNLICRSLSVWYFVNVVKNQQVSARMPKK